MSSVKIRDVREFWENNPLSATAIPFEPGTQAFFEYHAKLRDQIEPPTVQREVYEWDRHSGKRVLEVGCGTGFVVLLYTRGGAEVTAIDVAERSIDLTRRRLELYGLRARLQQGDAEYLAFKDNSFDLVTSFGVLHHTPDPIRAVAEVYRVLKPGGKVIMMFYHRNSFAFQVLFRLKRIFQREWRGKTPEEQVNAVDGPTNPLGRVFSKRELERLLRGFEHIEFKTGHLFFHWEHVLPKIISSVVSSRWGWFLYVKAYKPLGPSAELGPTRN